MAIISYPIKSAISNVLSSTILTSNGRESVLIIGQSLAVGIYDSTADGSTGGVDAMLSELESNTIGYTFNAMNEADGGTYVSQSTNLAGDAWMDDTVSPSVPAFSLINAIAGIAASGKTPTAVLFGIGESESNRVREGVMVGGVAKEVEHFAGWDEKIDLISGKINDGSVIIKDTLTTSLSYYRIYLTNTANEVVQHSAIVRKTTATQYPCFRCITPEDSGYVIFNSMTGEVTRIIGIYDTAPAVGEFFAACDADGTLNTSGEWLLVDTAREAIAAGTTQNIIYPAYSVDGTTLNSTAEIGSLMIRQETPTYTDAPWSVKPQVKAAFLGVFNVLRGLYGNIPCFIQKIGRREATLTNPWSATLGSGNIMRDIALELIAEYDWIYDAGEIYDYDILVPDTTNVHGTNADYVIGGTRHGKAIAAQIYNGRNAWRGATVTDVSLAGDVLTIDTTPENGAAYHADMAHDGSGVADLTPTATEASFVHCEVDGIAVYPASVVHHDESHATTPNQLIATYAAGTFTDSYHISVYYQWEFGTYYSGGDWLNTNPTKVVKDANSLPLRVTNWTKYGSESFVKIV